jgi:hypothetical protein
MPHPTLGHLNRVDQLNRANFLIVEFERLATSATPEQKVILRRMADAVPLDPDIYGPLDAFLKEHGA